MPNGNTHKTAGAVLVPIVYLTSLNNFGFQEKITLEELALTFCISLSSSRIPDILEPPIHPNHRAFFHSFAFVGITGYVGVKAWKDLKVRRSERIALGNPQWSFNEFLDVVIVITSGSILLHLIMDGFTPKGLTFV